MKKNTNYFLVLFATGELNVFKTQYTHRIRVNLFARVSPIAESFQLNIYNLFRYYIRYLTSENSISLAKDPKHMKRVVEKPLC